MEQPEHLDAPLAVALAWQPRASRGALAALFALDRRLAAAVARAHEPMLAQVRMAWWRERLAEPVAARPKGEPLLAAIGRHWGKEGAALIPLVDGWEHLVDGAPFGAAAVAAFAEGRGQVLASFAQRVGVSDAAPAAADVGRAWALAEMEQADRHAPVPRPAIGVRSLRGVAVLGGLATRALRRREPILADRAAALAAVRLGMFGS